MGTNTKTYSDQEIKDFLEQRKRNFETTARKSRGFEAKTAQQQLERIKGMSMSDLMLEARTSLQTLK